MKIKSIGALVLAGSLALTLGACSKSSDGGSTAGAKATATVDPNETSKGIVIANNAEPQKEMIPPMVNEVSGGKVIDLIWAGLVYYDKDGKTQMEVAKSIESPDQGKTWDVKLNDGWKFSDGSPVTAEDFVASWKWGALASNKALSAEYFSAIEGFNEEADSELTGLEVVSPTEFKITLSEPDVEFDKRLGYSAFYPMPAKVVNDPAAMAAYGQKPISNGPYILKDWKHNESLELVPNPDYKGGRKVRNGGITFKIYTADDAAYADLMSDQLDVLDSIPTTSLSSFRDDLGERAIDQPGAVWQAFTVPYYLPNFGQDEEGRLRRQALSMAIDRKEIVEKVFENTRSVATDFIAPVIPGHNDALKGAEVLKFDAKKAKELWKKANDIKPFAGKFELAYNADSTAHKAWVEAVCNQIKNNLGIEALPKPYPTFKEARSEASEGILTSALRSGWQADYPSGYNFLGPLYKKGAGSNDARYDNPEFEKALQEAVLAGDGGDPAKQYAAAQEILLKDLPAIPLWDQKALGGYSTKVRNVMVDWKTVPMYWEILKD